MQIKSSASLEQLLGPQDYNLCVIAVITPTGNVVPIKLKDLQADLHLVCSNDEEDSKSEKTQYLGMLITEKQNCNKGSNFLAQLQKWGTDNRLRFY